MDGVGRCGDTHLPATETRDDEQVGGRHATELATKRGGVATTTRRRPARHRDLRVSC